MTSYSAKHWATADQQSRLHGTIVIRADAGAEIGIGHVMRCVALAQSCRTAGARVIFALASGIDELGSRLEDEGFGVVSVFARPGSGEDAAQTESILRSHGAEWLVMDGYHFSSSYRRALAMAAPHVLLIDDHADFAPYTCDLVLNTNLFANEEMYAARGNKTELLLGPQYALIRQEFLSAREHQKEFPAIARRILITMGGSDPENVTSRVLDVLASIPALELAVVVGSTNPHRESITNRIKDCPCPVTLASAARDMPTWMNWADVAVSAGGVTCFELAFLGVPMFLLTIASNHERMVQELMAAKAAIAVGWFDSLGPIELSSLLRKVIYDGQLRRRISKNANRLVDGIGANRVVNAMERISERTALVCAK